MIGGRKNIVIVASQLSVATIAIEGNQEGQFYGWRRRKGIYDVTWGIGVKSETRFELNDFFFFLFLFFKKSVELDDLMGVKTNSVFNAVNRSLGIKTVSDLTKVDMTQPSRTRHGQYFEP